MRVVLVLCIHAQHIYIYFFEKIIVNNNKKNQKKKKKRELALFGLSATPKYLLVHLLVCYIISFYSQSFFLFRSIFTTIPH